ncbi:hypothetical protein A8D80_02525 [Burkholderia cenocepacia]|uniref:hypothetical protein n=1 Tax=Burkholderia cenocepacia TaxID=95486 RepID=UPI000981B794|nr:hypothetical protein [Burkholderia cenocepacia]ONO52741.1 hypothetical protein A8D73_27060 [Burkholderia cenocepacia]ONP24441.1 hypothetical protein A8D80_02525 [Burkholderia cenocepacia]
MINYITPELLTHLFPTPAAADEVEVTEPLSIDPSIEAVGVDFGGTRFVVFFADVMAYAGSDSDYVRQTAVAWNNGFIPAAGSRLVKFVRADADADTMFDPAEWPLPDPGMIWQFIEALAAAVEGYAVGFPTVAQYFNMPQTGKLDSLYNRMSRQFERGEYGVAFRCVTRPASDEGGFYGYERIEQVAPEGDRAAEVRPRDGA